MPLSQVPLSIITHYMMTLSIAAQIIMKPKKNDPQNNDTKNNDTQNNDTQNNDTQYNLTQH